VINQSKSKEGLKMNHLRETLSQYWLDIQSNLFPWLPEELGALTEKQQQLITILARKIHKKGRP
jgi:hypothetical protein